MNGWVAALAALGPASVITTLVTTFVQRRKIKAEEGKTSADAAAVLSETATELLAPLRAELRETRVELRAVRSHLTIVEGLLRENGIPVPEFQWPVRNGSQV